MTGKQKYKLKDNNDIATKAIRLCLERVRKLTGKSIKHWFITELGHEKTERLHLHGIVWGLGNGKKVTDNWKYGITFTGYFVNVIPYFQLSVTFFSIPQAPYYSMQM